jgi:sugar lactone lactonase YvrE
MQSLLLTRAVCRLRFANGVALSKDESFVIVVGAAVPMWMTISSDPLVVIQ